MLKHREVQIILIIAFLAILPLGVFYIPNKLQEYRIRNAFKNGQIVIDHDSHEWEIAGDSLKMAIHIRNNSQYEVSGNLVFSVNLNDKGLEEEYLTELIGLSGDIESYQSTLADLLEEEKEPNAIGRAVLEYTRRGGKLLKGFKFEPINGETKCGNYSFKFDEHVDLRPGGIAKIYKDQELPTLCGGFLVEIELEGIESNR